ncbi:hypothetical protein MSAN_02270000 [Mycena sanguinolenta]|uniref:Uncharacterized protein n=1 Tax=Mycena sanguinolenta TaxID=230812 RepID=A0A8H7CH35_9AGAR|nr:hypothetical protein MSAN_02270000 [Mycena sanguinolenta]
MPSRLPKFSSSSMGKPENWFSALFWLLCSCEIPNVRIFGEVVVFAKIQAQLAMRLGFFGTPHLRCPSILLLACHPRSPGASPRPTHAIYASQRLDMTFYATHSTAHRPDSIARGSASVSVYIVLVPAQPDPDNGHECTACCSNKRQSKGWRGTTRTTLRSWLSAIPSCGASDGTAPTRARVWASGVIARCFRAACPMCCPRRRKAHLPRFVGHVDALQHSAPAPSNLFPTRCLVPAPEADRVCDLSERV